jgi:hypothetical protein
MLILVQETYTGKGDGWYLIQVNTESGKGHVIKNGTFESAKFIKKQPAIDVPKWPFIRVLTKQDQSE